MDWFSHHASHPFFSDLGNNFFSIFPIFWDFSKTWKVTFGQINWNGTVYPNAYFINKRESIDLFAWYSLHLMYIRTHKITLKTDRNSGKHKCRSRGTGFLICARDQDHGNLLPNSIAAAIKSRLWELIAELDSSCYQRFPNWIAAAINPQTPPPCRLTPDVPPSYHDSQWRLSPTHPWKLSKR